MNVKLAAVAAAALGGTAGVVFAVWQGLHHSVAAESASATAAPSSVPVLPPPTPDATIAIRWLPRTVSRFEPVLVAAGKTHGVDPEMLAIVTLVESGGWVGAESPTGARGLMQIMPATGKAIGEERGLLGHETKKLADPRYNVDFGAWYFARMLERFRADDLGETIRRAAAAYNGGPTRLDRHLAGEGDLSDQTTRYRHWVGGMWDERRDETSATFEEWLAAGGARLVGKARLEMATAPTITANP